MSEPKPSYWLQPAGVRTGQVGRTSESSYVSLCCGEDGSVEPDDTGMLCSPLNFAMHLKLIKKIGNPFFKNFKTVFHVVRLASNSLDSQG